MGNFRKSLQVFVVIILVIALGGCSEAPETQTLPGKVKSARVVANKAYMNNALELIRSAQKSLHLCQLYMNEDGAVDYLVDELEKASRRGVEITAIVNHGDGKSQKAIRRLRQMGADVNWVSRGDYGKIHAKLIVADRKDFLIGSTNWSAMSIYNTNEVNLRVNHSGLAGHYAKWIEELHSSPDEDPELQSTETKEFKTLTGRQISTHLPKLFKGAKKRIWLGIYILKAYFDKEKYSNSPVNKAVKELSRAAERGVDVRVILEESNYSDFVNEINKKTERWLKENGVKVRRDPEKKTSHWKLLIVDDRALVSSMNWGHSGFSMHAEAGLLTSHPRTVAELNDYFLNLWRKDG